MSVTTEFIAERMTGIGGSDAAAILGLSPFQSKHQVYMSKVGLGEPIDENERMFWGTVLEAPIANRYQKDHPDLKLIEAPMFRHPQHNFMIAHLDRIVQNGQPDPIRGLEVKTTDGRMGWHWGESGSDEVPDYYNIQVQHYMAVTGLKEFDMAVLIGGNDYRWFRIPRSDEIIGVLIEQEKLFWSEHVVPQIPPPADCTEGSSQLLKVLFPKDNGEEAVWSQEFDDLVAEFFETEKHLKEVTAEKKGLQNHIKELMANAAVLKTSGYGINYKAHTRRTIDYKGLLAELGVDDKMIGRFTTIAEQRPLRITQKKGGK